MDTNLFFDKYESDLSIAKGIDEACMSCPVIKICYQNGTSNNDYGVWGGVYFEKGKMSKEFNSHKKQNEWFSVWQALTMDDK
jgi:hypothetical protein